MIPLVNDNSPNAINTSLIAVKRELQTLLDAIKKINPTQEIIEQGGGKITELTQAEYDALTEAEKMADVIYMIDDETETIADILIDDENVADNKTWSSEKISGKIPIVKSGIIDITKEGNSTMGSATVGYGTKTVSYSGFTSTPIVMATAIDSGLGVFGVELETQPTLNNVQITAYGNSSLTTYKVAWVAIGY